MDVKEVRIIPSKSFGHRAYICDLLAGDEGHGVICDLDSDDIRATRSCIEALEKGEDTLDAGESGSTLRFMLPLAGALGRDAAFITRGRLAERPILPLEEELTAHGMKISHSDNGEIMVSGQLVSGVYRLPGDISSQFITGLLLSLPYLEGDSRIELLSELKSKAYVDITLSVLRDYGVSIEEHGDIYEIKGGQKYSCSRAYEVEGDWSQAAFWLAAGLIGDAPVRVRGLRADSVQGDRKIIEILRNMGGLIEYDDETSSFTSFPTDLKGAEIDVSEVPDLAPAIAAAAAFAGEDTRLFNAGRLRLKESDRIDSIVGCLTDLGFSAEGSADEILIRGSSGTGGTARTYGDHRIVMMAAVLSLSIDGEVRIEDKEAVRKSYPAFFDEFENCFGRRF